MIEKQVFIQALETIQNQLLKDKTNSLLMKEAFGINDDFVYDTSHLQMQIIDLLSIWFDKDDLIHYCYETNFGKPSSESECLEIADFYDILTKNK
jgi:hypothetical protein